MRDIIRPGLVLFIITLVAAVCLGAVHKVTEEPIAQQKLQRTNESMRRLLPSAVSFDEQELDPDGMILGLTIGYTDEGNTQLNGYVMTVRTSGFGGGIELLVGISADGLVEGVEFVSHSETPGLGANAEKPVFIDQYKGKEGPFTVVKSAVSDPASNDIQAITSATITSDAVTDGVNAALTYYQDHLMKGAA